MPTVTLILLVVVSLETPSPLKCSGLVPAMLMIRPEQPPASIDCALSPSHTDSNSIIHNARFITHMKAIKCL